MDNDQAIKAAQRGYSKKLKDISRTHRVSIGVISECISDPRMQCEIQYCPGVENKADLFTQTLIGSVYVGILRRCGLHEQT